MKRSITNIADRSRIFSCFCFFRNFGLYATFEEFVAYLLDPLNADVTRDIIEHGSSLMKMTSVRHWQSFHSLAYPCHFDYDVIAHMETIDDDARLVETKITKNGAA